MTEAKYTIPSPKSLKFPGETKSTPRLFFQPTGMKAKQQSFIVHTVARCTGTTELCLKKLGQTWKRGVPGNHASSACGHSSCIAHRGPKSAFPSRLKAHDRRLLQRICKAVVQHAIRPLTVPPSAPCIGSAISFVPLTGPSFQDRGIL